jgi:hypothetical protein
MARVQVWHVRDWKFKKLSHRVDESLGKGVFLQDQNIPEGIWHLLCDCNIADIFPRGR